MSQINFNNENAFIGLIKGAPAAAFAAGECDPEEIEFVGIIASGTPFTIQQNQNRRSSSGDDLILTWILNLNIEILTTLTTQQRNALDGTRASVVIIPSDGVDIDPATLDDLGDADPAGLANITGMTILAPTLINITEETEFGTGEVQPITLTGSQVGGSKADLRKPLVLASNE